MSPRIFGNGISNHCSWTEQDRIQSWAKNAAHGFDSETASDKNASNLFGAFFMNLEACLAGLVEKTERGPLDG